MAEAEGPSDLPERAYLAEHMEVYEDALAATTMEEAARYVVPADNGRGPWSPTSSRR
jgi:hypothetical protein